MFDVYDDALLTRYHEIADRAELFDRPWEFMWSLEEMKANFRMPNAGERQEAYAAFDGDAMIGAALGGFALLDNTDKVYAHISVEPELRRRGIGSALADFVAERTRAENRTTVLGESSYRFEDRETHPYLKFAKKNGFDVANIEIVRVLDLPVPRASLETMRDEAAPHHAAYRIETYVDDIPESYLESYCYLKNQLVLDAPMGDFDFEEEAITPETFLERSAQQKSVGRVRYSALAVDTEGTVVAHTDLVLPPDGHKVLQWGTLVRRDHRGHRLGTAVKVANLLALQTGHPERTEVHTTNAEVNQAMVQINDRFGFAPVAVCPGFQRKL